MTTQTVYRLGLDIETHDVKKVLRALLRLKSTVSAVDGGMYHEDAGYSQVHVETSKTEDEMDKWLYDRGFDYCGVFCLATL